MDDRAGPFQISGKKKFIIMKKLQELMIIAGGKTRLLRLSICQKCDCRLQIFLHVSFFLEIKAWILY